MRRYYVTYILAVALFAGAGCGLQWVDNWMDRMCDESPATCYHGDYGSLVCDSRDICWLACVLTILSLFVLSVAHTRGFLGRSSPRRFTVVNGVVVFLLLAGYVACGIVSSAP
jgi:hypothetical protein